MYIYILNIKENNHCISKCNCSLHFEGVRRQKNEFRGKEWAREIAQWIKALPVNINQRSIPETCGLCNPPPTQ